MTDDDKPEMQVEPIPAGQHVSDTRYRRLFETARDGILIVDGGSGEIIDANPFLAELLGHAPDALLGKELWEIGLFRDRRANQLAFQELQSAGFIRQDLQIHSQSGEPLTVVLACNVYKEDERQLVQCNIRDITERYAAREQLAQSAAMLAQIAGKAARLGGWSIELPERKLTWSDENCVIHDVPPGYQPTLHEGVGYFPPEYRAEVMRHVDKCARDGTAYDFEFPKYTAKGRLIWVRSIGEAVRDASGRIIRLQGAFQDITKRKQVETEREKLIEQLQTALAEVKTLRGILPICMYCKKIRDDEGAWTQIEGYIRDHTDAQFSHGMCEPCAEKMFPGRFKSRIDDQKDKTRES